MKAAIDLGNSRLKVLRSDGFYASWQALSVDWSALEEVLNPADEVIVSSVNPAVEPALQEFLRTKWQVVDARHLIEQRPLPVTIQAEGIGIDRVLGVLGALRYATPPLMVVDLGTATTATIVDQHWRVVGGYILPGMELQLRAMRQTFPHLVLPSGFEECRIEPGTHTLAAVQAGICLSMAAFLRTARAEAEKCCAASSLAVVATGGAAARVLSCLPDFACTVVPTLVLEGALKLLMER
ncbi:MAG: type III pantothenate kinase [Bacteroidota bacterium]|nr:type III pantothenate kinase [Bacteroidota bacterium]